MDVVSVKSTDLETCDFLSVSGRSWFVRLEKKARPLQGLGTFWEVWGLGNKVALFRKGDIGCHAKTAYAINWENVRHHLKNFLVMGYELNTEAVKQINVKELEVVYQEHQPRFFPRYPPPDPGPEPPRSLKELEKSRQRKADW